MLRAFLFLLLANSLHAADLRVGFAVADITPPAGYRMAGNYTEVLSTGVHDKLYAKAIYFENAGTKAAIVCCDVCGQERGLTDAARAKAEKATTIPTTNISITATHTHGGPMHYDPILLDLFQTPKSKTIDDEYRAKFTGAIATVIADAQKAAKPATLEVGTGTVPGIAFNRRYHMKTGPVRFNPGKLNPDIVKPAGPNPDDVPFLLVKDAATGQPFGSLTTFDMHVTTYGGRTFSADYPGHLQTELRKTYGESFISIFGEGCGGDVNQVNTATKEKDATPEQVGAKLAAAILTQKPAPVAKPTLAMKGGFEKCPLRADRPDELAAMRDKMIGEASKKVEFLDQVEAYRVLYVHRFRKQFGGDMPLEVQAFRLGDDTAIVTLPHEVFVELGREIKKASPFKHTFVVSIANEVDCYVPTRKAFDEGSYEVTNSPYQPGVGERLVDQAGKLLKELK